MQTAKADDLDIGFQSDMAKLALVVLLFGAWVLSVPMGLVATWLVVVTALIGRFPALRLYAAILAILALIAPAFAFTVIGVHSPWAWVAIAVVVLALHGALRRRPLPPVTDVLNARVLYAAVFLLASMLVSKAWRPDAGIGWVMEGDATNLIVMMRDLRALDPGEVLHGYFPGWATGHSLAANALIEATSGPATRLLTTEVEANVAILLAGFVLGANQIALAVRWRRQALLVVFLQGAAIAVLLASGLFAGLVGANGFMTVGLAFGIYCMLVTALWRQVEWPCRTNALAALAAIAGLAMVWQPLAIVGFAALVPALIPALRRFAMPLALVLPSAAFWLVGRLYADASTFPGTGYFPVVPVAAFLAYLVALFATARHRRRPVVLTTLISAMAIGGAVAVTLYFGSGGPRDFAVAAHQGGVSPFYYALKFLWLAMLPGVMLLLVNLLRARNHGRRSGVLAAGFVGVLLLSSYMASDTPSAPWLPLTDKDHVVWGAQIALDDQAAGSPLMYFRYRGWVIDSVLNGWSGVDWEPYRGNGGAADEESPVSYSGAFGNRGWWSGTDDAATLCAGLALLPEGGTLRTSDSSLTDAIAATCPGELAETTVDVAP